MNYQDLLQPVPDTGRVWVYATRESVKPEVQNRLLSQLRTFLNAWRSHGRVCTGEAVLIDGRFIVVGGNVADGSMPSGCSIDRLTHAVEAAAVACGIVLLSPLYVFYRDGRDCIQAATRGAFRRLVQADTVRESTPVFDLSITTVKALRSGQFERPFAASWHARVFRRLSTVGA